MRLVFFPTCSKLKQRKQNSPRLLHAGGFDESYRLMHKPMIHKNIVNNILTLHDLASDQKDIIFDVEFEVKIGNFFVLNL